MAGAAALESRPALGGQSELAVALGFGGDGSRAPDAFASKAVLIADAQAAPADSRSRLANLGCDEG